MKSLVALFVLAMIWAVGLFTFAGRVDQARAPADPPVADGVVALTGKSSRRIEAAMDLLEAGKARRLLVSGVNREATRADIRAVAGGDPPIYDCCVDLGFEATSTLGNAEETRAWVRRYDFEHLIVVTGDFHMPRSLLELRAALPGVTLTPYPVRTPSLARGDWWRDAAAARLMVLEYSKYLAVLFREAFLSLGPREEPPAPAQTSKAPAG